MTTFLNSTTMYRLMRYLLGSLALIAITFGFVGWLPFSGITLAIHLLVLVFVCGLTNHLLAKIFSAPINEDSSWITALILFFLVLPSNQTLGLTVLAGVLAMASKYLFVWRSRHIFNPAAAGAFLATFFGAAIYWWVATPILLPFVAIVGTLIVLKTRRNHVVTVFLLAALVSVLVVGLRHGLDPLVALTQAFASWPILFFATVMLTEPMTLPSKRSWQLVEAVLVGLLFAVSYHFGPIYSSPELTLLLGNLLAFVVSTKSTVRLTLAERQEPAPGVLDLGFTTDQRLIFEPGQYVEWTLPHKKMDARGARRTFTVASAPSESFVRIGVRLAKEKGSSFKSALSALPMGGTIFASNVGGDFTLPHDSQKKLVFIAGGIGITPFRSFAETMIAKKDHRDAVLFYCAASDADFVYRSTFDLAVSQGIKTHYLTTFLTEAFMRQEVTDFANRLFYLSGPPKMVDTYRAMLKKLGVSPRHIRTDYFPGY